MQTTKTNLTSKTVVVVPSYNGGDETLHCVDLLLKYSGEAKIVVVDNASSDDSVANIVKNYPEVVVISETKNTGYAGAAQRGYEVALKYGADFLSVVNQDVEVTENWLQELLTNFDDEQVGCVQPLVLDSNNGKINAAGCSIHYLGFGFAIGNGSAQNELENISVPVSYSSGACVVVKMSAIKDIGFCMPDFFMYHEDLDLGWRMLLQGKKNLVDKKVKVNHRYEFGRSAKIKYEFGERNRLRVLLMNYQLKTLLLLFPAWLAMEIGVVSLSVWSGWLPEKIRGYKYIIVKLPEILEERKRRQLIRTTPDKELVNVFSSEIKYQEGAEYMLEIANPIFAWYWRIIRKLL